MITAEKCPVCEGKGELPFVLPEVRCTGTKTCHGCHGMGWVVVEQLDVQEVWGIESPPRNVSIPSIFTPAEPLVVEYAHTLEVHSA